LVYKRRKSYPDWGSKGELTMEYKTGDIVLVKAKINNVDPNDEFFPYDLIFDDLNGLWVTPEEVVALVEREEETVEVVEEKVEEPKVKLKYKVGDKVIHKFKPEWNVGIISSINESQLHVPEYMVHGYGEESKGEFVAPYNVMYPDFKWEEEDSAFRHKWWTTEENLILVKDTEEN
jgi:hypothetical protein